MQRAAEGLRGISVSSGGARFFPCPAFYFGIEEHPQKYPANLPVRVGSQALPSACDDMRYKS